LNTRPGELAELERRAAAGQVEALAALGERLLADGPGRQDEALKLLHAAAVANHPDAARLLARAIVRDITDRQHWRVGLDWLARAAMLGSIAAQIELGFLAGEGGAILEAVSQGRPLPATLWERLHRAVDVAAWTATPPSPAQIRTASSQPLVQVIEGFASPEVCDWIVHWARPRLTPSTSYDRQGGRSVASHYTASPELDFVVTAVIHRIAVLTGALSTGREGTSVLRYQPGQAFEPHYDFMDPRVPELAAELAREGQRDMTFLLSLTDDFDGGETDFPKAQVRYKGRKGDAVLWRNVTSAGLPDYDALHAGLATTRGEKWAFVRVCSRGPARASTAV
jgi:prolyl 4-hydroxylase